MKQLYTTLLLAIAIFAAAQGDSTRVTHRFGGRVDLLAFADSYTSVESRNGVLYFYPQKPTFDSRGNDLNFRPTLRFTAAASRINYTVGITNLAGATGTGFIEGDFLGTGDNILGAFRLRHAYFNLKWKNSHLLMGQTWHLLMPEEAQGGSVTFGGGFPYYPLNRPPQIQFGWRTGEGGYMTLAAAIFGGGAGAQQSSTLIPDLQLKYARAKWGVIGGMRAINPRALTTAGARSTSMLLTFDAAAYARLPLGGGYVLKMYGLWGQDLSPLQIMGGYAPLEGESKTRDDYGYAGIGAASGFVDIESGISKKGWQWGALAGAQKNTGAAVPVDLEGLIYPNAGIDFHFRIAPRVYYHIGKHVTFGAEYLLSGASWGKEFCSKYFATESYPMNFNNRVTILGRYRF